MGRSNPFGSPGTVAYIGYHADKRDGRGEAVYHHDFNESHPPTMKRTPAGRLTLAGGGYWIGESGGKLWLENGGRAGRAQSRRLTRSGPRSTFHANEGEDTEGRSSMSKRSKAGRLTGRVLFTSKGPHFQVSGKSKYAPKHRRRFINFVGSLIRGAANPPLATTDLKVWLRRGLSLAAGGGGYYGTRMALEKFQPGGIFKTAIASEIAATGVGAAVGAGFGYFIVRDKWAALFGLLIPAIVGGRRIYEIQKIDSARATGAVTPPGATVTSQSSAPASSSTGSIGATITDNFGRTIGRLVGELTDNQGRVIGNILQAPSGERVFVQNGRVIGRLPLAYDSSVSRVPLAFDSNVSRVPLALDSSVSAIPVP